MNAIDPHAVIEATRRWIAEIVIGLNHYTNRSPYPMLHLLREESIDAIALDEAELLDIPRRNIEHVACAWSGGDPREMRTRLTGGRESAMV